MHIPQTSKLLKMAQMGKKETSLHLQRETSGECSQANFGGKLLRPCSSTPSLTTARTWEASCPKSRSGSCCAAGSKTRGQCVGFGSLGTGAADAACLSTLTPPRLSSFLLSWKTSHLGGCHHRGTRLPQCLLVPLDLKRTQMRTFKNPPAEMFRQILIGQLG